jgi:hypothetical protein
MMRGTDKSWVRQAEKKEGGGREKERRKRRKVGEGERKNILKDRGTNRDVQIHKQKGRQTFIDTGRQADRKKS